MDDDREALLSFNVDSGETEQVATEQVATEQVTTDTVMACRVLFERHSLNCRQFFTPSDTELLRLDLVKYESENVAKQISQGM
jgi:hypothetical protein